MKFNCGPTREARDAMLRRWHRYFAFFPVRVGERECVWLEWVERMGTQHMCGWEYVWTWEYRRIEL